MVADDSTEELRRRKQEARQSGGPERIAARRERGVSTARERVLQLLDPDTFVELDVFVEGAVTGHGRIGGRDVYLFSQDGEAPPDARGRSFTRKIVKVMDLAAMNGAPLIGLYDGGMASLGGHADIVYRNVMASGLVPQISAVMGPCTGTAVLSPALNDLVIMVKGGSHLLLGDSGSLRTGADDEVGLEEIGGARTHSEMTGVSHLAADDEAECLQMIRDLLSYLPQNNLEETPLAWTGDPVDRMDEELDSLALSDSGGPRDIREIIAHVVDDGGFTELMPRWAKNLVIGFARLAGRAVGIVANQPVDLDGRIDLDATIKGARFVRLCDTFNLPVVTLVDTPGVLPGKEQGDGRMVREAAKLMYAYCEATVPKVTLITHRAYAEGFEVMGSKHIGTDFSFAWPSAEIAAKAPAGSLDRQDLASPYDAAVSGHLDDVIEPTATRPRLIDALEACASKRESRPPKKHGNIPL